jgi:hypothetical protein
MLTDSLAELISRKDLAKRYIDYCVGNEKSPFPYNLPTEYASDKIQIDDHTRFQRSIFRRPLFKSLKTQMV